MIKTYSMALLGVLLVGMQSVQAQESMDDVFAQLDAANEADGQPTAVLAAETLPVAPSAQITSTKPAEQAVVQQQPVAGEPDVLSALFEKGLELYKAGKYDGAIMAFDAMLAIDKYDSRAVAYKKRAAQRMGSKEIRKQDASRAQAYADVHASWNQDPKNLTVVKEADDGAAMNPDRMAIQQMVARLKAFTLPNLDFRDANIADVVYFLGEATRRIDRDGGDVDFLLVGMDQAMGLFLLPL